MSWFSSERWRVEPGRVAAMCALLAVVAPVAHAQGSIVMKVDEDVIRWRTKAEVGEWVLRISGPKTDLSRTFKPPEAPFVPVDLGKRGVLAEGIYRYELRGTPRFSSEDKRRLASAQKAREQGQRVNLERLGLSVRGLSKSGSFAVRDGAFVTPGEPEPGPRVKQTGDVEVEGSLRVNGAKSFVAVDPADADRRLVYVSLEGPEAGTYLRGASRTVGGEAVIELPAHFGAVTEAEGLTVQLTPTGAWSRLYVAERSPSRLVVRSVGDGGDEGGDDVAFDYLIQGVRLGYSDFQVEHGPVPVTHELNTEEQ